MRKAKCQTETTSCAHGILSLSSRSPVGCNTAHCQLKTRGGALALSPLRYSGIVTFSFCCPQDTASSMSARADRPDTGSTFCGASSRSRCRGGESRLKHLQPVPRVYSLFSTPLSRTLPAGSSVKSSAHRALTDARYSS
jgi:hypothetical protein